MRVLHININYIGSSLHQTMIEHMNRLGINSLVFAPTYDKSSSVVECMDYVTVSECFNKWDRVLYYKKQHKIISALKKTYDVSSFDIIHAYTLFTDGNVAYELFRQYGIPYVVAIRSTDVNAFFKKMIYLRKHGVEILRNASSIFFLSSVYRDIVLNTYVPKELRDEIFDKSYIIPNGIDDFWHDNTFKRECKSLLNRIRNERILKCIFVGSIDKRKNAEITLQALTKLNTEGWSCTLTTVGRVVDQSVFKRLNKYECFNYLGPKTKEELIECYRSADIFVMPSHTETFGLVYAEAMSQGLPVLYTKGQGFDGQFNDGDVGYSVNDRSATDIKNKLLKTIDNYSIISSNCSLMHNQFNWNKICEDYYRIYINCV